MINGCVITVNRIVFWAGGAGWGGDVRLEGDPRTPLPAPRFLRCPTTTFNSPGNMAHYDRLLKASEFKYDGGEKECNQHPTLTLFPTCLVGQVGKNMTCLKANGSCATKPMHKVPNLICLNPYVHPY